MANKKATAFTVVTTVENTDYIPLVRTSEPNAALKNSIITGANLKSQINYPQVANYSSLPSPASSYAGQIYVVLAGEGIYLINRKDAGLYYSDGASWLRLGNVPAYFSDLNFRIYNSSDNTKQIQTDVSAVATGTTRTVTFPNADVDLGDINTDTLQSVTDRGATTTNTTTFSPTGNNKAIVANGSGSGIGIDIAHGGSGVKLNIGATGAGDLIVADGFSVSNTGVTTAPRFTGSNGNLDINKTGSTLQGNFISASDNSVELNLTNSAGSWRIRNNATNNDLLFQQDGTTYALLGGNLTSGIALNITQSALTINIDGVDRNTIIEGLADPTLFHADAGLDRVAIGNGSPAEKLHVTGNIKSTGYLDLDAIAAPATPSAGDLRLHAFTDVNRTFLRFMDDLGMDIEVQCAFYNCNIMIVSVPSGTTVPMTYNCNVQASTTMSMQQTVASANKWLATRRKRHTSAAAINTMTGFRINYGICSRGNAAGYGGFFFVQRFGHNLNVNGTQMFIGLCSSTGALGSAAGAVSALTDMIGVGYDTTDSSAGNWQFFYNDNAGTATKVDLGANAVRSNVSHGYELIIFNAPNSGDFYVKITNIHTGTVVLNTSYNTNVPTANVPLCQKSELNTSAVASATDIDWSICYIMTNF